MSEVLDDILGSASHIYQQLEWSRLLELIDARPEERILEVGCGYGRHVALLKKRGLDITGLENRSDILEKACQKINPNLFNLGSYSDLPYEDNTFDVVILSLALNFCQDPKDVLAEAGRVANRRVIIEVLNPFSWLGIRLRFGEQTSRPAHWHSYTSINKLIKSVMGSCPVKKVSGLTIPPSLLTMLKSIEESPLFTVSPFGSLIFVAVDIRYTHRTRPLKDKVRLTRQSSGGTIKLKPAPKVNKEAVNERSISLR